jgi:Luciferase-like monooxygenase
VPKIELGTIGAVLSPGDGNAFVDTAVALEELGYQTIWLTGGPLESLSQIADVVRATKRARVATGIISVDRFGADEVSALYADLQATHPGRLVVGLGGAHGPWGDADSVATAISRQLDAGADHVAISVTADEPQVTYLSQWRQLAERLIAA